MSLVIDGRTYYRTAEVCLTVGISKSTLFRWIKDNIAEEAEHRDRKGWRLFTKDEVHRLEMVASRIQRNEVGGHRKIPSESGVS